MSDKEVIKEIIQETGKVTEMLGLSSSVGRIWSTLHFKGHMTQNQIKNETELSLGAVSQSLKMLENLGLIEVSGKDGRKKIHSSISLKKAKNKKIENMLTFYIKPMAKVLDNKLKSAKDKQLKGKISKLKKNYEYIEKLFKIINRVSSK